MKAGPRAQPCILTGFPWRVDLRSKTLQPAWPLSACSLMKWVALASRSAEPNHCIPFRSSQSLLNPHDARDSASLTLVKLLQLGNSIVGATEPPTKLAVDVLYHHDIRMNVGFVARVELSGREFVQHGWALCDDGG